MQMPSLPIDYQARIEQQFPEEAAALFDALIKEPSVAVRYNAAKLTTHPFTGVTVPWCKEAVTLAQRPNFTLDPRLHLGAYYVQEASSMAIQAALDAWAASRSVQLSEEQSNRPLRLLDLCAAPGGKSTLLAAWKSPRDLLLANEIMPLRRVILRENLQKWGALGCYVSGQQADAIESSGQWNVVLVDAPCSGEGLFRREPFARTQWNQSLVFNCALTQTKLLEEAVRLVAPGGLLVFSTCTAAPQENEDNSLRLARHPDLETLTLPSLFEQGWLPQGAGALALPHRVPGEGFFLSCFRKNPHAFTGSNDVTVSSVEMLEDSLREQFAEPLGIRFPQNFQLVESEDSQSLSLESPEHQGFWQSLRSPKPKLNDSRKVKHSSKFSAKPEPGLIESTAQIAERKGRDWIPTAAGALLSDLIFSETAHEVDRPTALALLKGESPTGGLAPKPGWTLLRYENLPLMWTKQLGNRYNSIWPKPWRIRMRVDR